MDGRRSRARYNRTPMPFGERAQRLAQARLVAAVDEHRARPRLAAAPTFSDSTIALTGPIAAADIDRWRKPMRDQRHRLQRPAADLAAQRDRRAVALAGLGDRACSARRKPAESGSNRFGDALVVAVGGVEILHQIVRADRQEIGALGAISSSLPEQRGHFDHHAEFDRLRRVAPDAAREFELAIEQFAPGDEFGDGRDHRQHHAQIAARGGAQHRAQLHAQQRRAGRARCASRASPAPDSPPRGPSCRAAPCRRRCRACGRSRAARPPRRAPRR